MNPDFFEVFLRLLPKSCLRQLVQLLQIRLKNEKVQDSEENRATENAEQR